MTGETHIPAHELDEPDPERELRIAESGLAANLEHIREVETNLGVAFDYAYKAFGYHVVLGRPKQATIAALRRVSELGVALFRRGVCGPQQWVDLAIAGKTISVRGGVTRYTSAWRWIDAIGAAVTLRDEGAVASLVDFDTRSFEATPHAYLPAYIEGLKLLLEAHDDASTRLAEALQLLRSLNGASEKTLRVDAPTIEVTQAIAAGDEAGFNAALARALTAYKTVYSRQDVNYLPERMVPLHYVGLCALATGRGFECRVSSGYLPDWLVAGELPEEE